jgi:hypothetical protein
MYTLRRKRVRYKYRRNISSLITFYTNNSSHNAEVGAGFTRVLTWQQFAEECPLLDFSRSKGSPSVVSGEGSDTHEVHSLSISVFLSYCHSAVTLCCHALRD